MPLCPRCGEDNSERARFCFACGTALGTAWTGATELRKVVTLLFTDVTGSTSLAERVDAETVRSVMNRYFEAARRVVERHGGNVEKFVGDAVVAVFGVPQVHEDDALRAVRAALDVNEELAALNDELEAAYEVRLELSTGVSTGEVAVGAGEAVAMGDAVNVAARLQHDAAPGEILIAEPTRRLVRDAVEVEPSGTPAQGDGGGAASWRLLGLVGDVALARRLDAPLVDREQELTGLGRAYDGALQTRGCRLFTVLGAAGIGKSRLVREFVTTVEDEASVLFGRCLPYGEGITYWPLAEVVRHAAAIEPELSADDAFRRIAGLLGPDPDAELVADRVAGAIGLGTGGAPPEIFWAVRRLLEAVAAERPLVVVFDDIHWAEPTFLDLVEHLAERIRAVPVLLLCMARPELLEERPAWTRDRERASFVNLGPLSESESSLLIESLGADAPVDPALRERISAAADGNPLFVEELHAMLVDDAGRRAGELALPPTIQALLAARLDRLGPRERDVIGRASIIGQGFTRRAVAELAEGRAIAPILGSLVRKELLDQAGEGFQFRHLLIRDAAYVSLPKALRADLHERYARYLAEAAGERLGEVQEIVGYQLEQAYSHRTALAPPDEHARTLAIEAAGHLQAGGARASARGDLPAAAGLLERSLALLPPDDERRPQAQAFAGATLLELGQLERADHHLAEAEETAKRSRIRAVEISAGLARTLIRAQSEPGYDPTGPVQAAEAAIPELEQLGADAALAGVWRMLVITRLIEHNPAALEHAAERALETARRLGDARGEAEALFWLSLAIAIGGTTVEAGVRRYESCSRRRPGLWPWRPSSRSWAGATPCAATPRRGAASCVEGAMPSASSGSCSTRRARRMPRRPSSCTRATRPRPSACSAKARQCSRRSARPPRSRTRRACSRGSSPGAVARRRLSSWPRRAAASPPRALRTRTGAGRARSRWRRRARTRRRSHWRGRPSA
jgi:class 3 adenylate cyclase/tetratricopeptide (TPR) repeat protein